MVRSEDVIAAKENRSYPQDGSILVSDAEQSFFHTGHKIATGPMTIEDFFQSQSLARVAQGVTRENCNISHLAYRQVRSRERNVTPSTARNTNSTSHALRSNTPAALSALTPTIGLDTQARLREARNILYGIKENSCRENPPGSKPHSCPDAAVSPRPQRARRTHCP
jgi:hypothetical protein